MYILRAISPKRVSQRGLHLSGELVGKMYRSWHSMYSDI
jgi:hypothetical protein